LSQKEKQFHEGAMIGMLASIQDDLDEAIAEAYGWPTNLTDEQLLERLVALNKERAEEEEAGLVRWLRPSFQAPDKVEQKSLTKASKKSTAAAPIAKALWPKEPTERLIALRNALRSANAPRTTAELAGGFKGARKATVEKMLQALVSVGAIVNLGEEGFAVPG